MSHELAATLNETCNCTGADVEQLWHRIRGELQAALPDIAPAVSHPHLFSSVPVFLAQEHAERMQLIINAIERVVRLPAYRQQAFGQARALSGAEPVTLDLTLGVFAGYDFHITHAGPQLIEINTNAGGAALNLQLLAVQLGCCAESRELSASTDPQGIAAAYVAMFRNEWRLARGLAPLRCIAIVDTSPLLQYLYPEFLLFQQLLQAHGVRTLILDPAQLRLSEGRLLHENECIDLVYNRLTDFYFEQPQHAQLREASHSGAAVFTPAPHHHALYADKRNLVVLSDHAKLLELGAELADADLLQQSVPRSVMVDAAEGERWWQERKRWFFKPASGYGSRGVYRGDKLTRGVFAEILRGGYIAQQLVTPSEREHAASTAGVLKLDVRNYAYDGRVQLLAARLYRGQATNFRTPGGGFAPVFLISEERLARARACASNQACGLR